MISSPTGKKKKRKKRKEKRERKRSPIFPFIFFSNPSLNLLDLHVGPTNPMVNLKNGWMEDGRVTCLKKK